MACATLKRSLEFDPVHSHGRPNKRRRCIPMSSVSPSAHSSNSCGQSPGNNSPFGEVTNKLTPEKMAANLREEIRRLNKRKQLTFTSQSDSSDMETPNSPSSPSCSSSNYNSNSCTKEKPLFTFRQVGLICERMLKEQEVKIREEYDQVLSLKLSEQYDTFVKFTYDQIQKRFESAAAPSYLS
ncbi:akirin-2 [Copidosoma floridanum]|uniref:akirin-2 n=1 Tax=Copidosoma floridanum TaxID=29053 RepID=UPI0006C9DBEA|nr:akirin-2 [Copidosoma floridanum]